VERTGYVCCGLEERNCRISPFGCHFFFHTALFLVLLAQFDAGKHARPTAGVGSVGLTD
jgi:hypothetical protein